MKKTIAAFLIVLILLPSFLFSEPLAEYVPYEEGEFPIWSYTLRRAETIFFGSMVITIPLSILLYSVAQSTGVVGPPSSELNEVLTTAAIAATLSLGVSITDWALGIGK